MPVTELATFPLTAGSNVNDKTSHAGELWQTICQTVSRQDNFEGLFSGHEVESPNVIQLFVNWDSLESHKKFMASPEYEPMVQKLKKILAGEPQFLHYEFPSASKLASALSAPVTEVATFFLQSKTSTFESDVEMFSKIVEEDASGFLGIATAWSIEDVEHEKLDAGTKGKALLLAIGWSSIEAHMAFRETNAFKENIGLLRGEPKGAEMHHVTIQP